MTSLLPPNATDLERAVEASLNASIDAVPVGVRDLWNSEKCPVDLLPWLAWALSVDNWNAAWTEDVKRSVIAQSVEIHRRKGTIGALRRAMDALGHGIEISEWHQYAGEPYHFKLGVELADRGLSDDEQSEILLTTEQVKNARSVLESFIIYLTGRGYVYTAIALQTGDMCTVYPYAVTEIEQALTPVAALAIYGAETTTIYPQ